MTPEGLYDSTGRTPPWHSGRPYVPAAREPGPRADGLTRDWTGVLALAQMAREAHEREAADAAKQEAPRHAKRRHAAARAAWQAASTVLLVAGLLIVAAGMAAGRRADR